MITVEKLEKGTYFDDAFKISFRYDPTTVAKVKELAERRYLPEDRAWEIPAHELPALIEKVGLSNIKSEEAVVQALNTKEIEDKREATQERLKGIKPVRDFDFKTAPLPHQIEAFNYGMEKNSLLIGDEQGLGKTKESIDICVARKKELIKTLIVCGVNSVKYNWEKEIQIHSNEGCVMVDGKTMDVRVQQLNDWYRSSSYFGVINIESLRNEKIQDALYLGIKDGYIGAIIVDEIHKAKNGGSQQGKALRFLKAPVKIGLSGTPMNKAEDLWNILTWLGVERRSFYSFRNAYCTMGGFGGYKVIGYKNLDNMIEQSLLCKVLDAPDLEILHSNGVIEEMFLTCKDEIHFIIEHYNSYKQMPDKLTFLGRFKDFQMLEVTESTDYLVYKLKEAYTYTKLVPLIEDTAKVVKEDSIKAIQYLKEEIEKLEKSVPVSRNKDGYDIISNAGDRLTEYKKRCEVKGLIGIPTGIPKLDEITNGWLWGEDLVVVFMAIVVIGIYLGFKREFYKLIGFLVVALIAVGLVFNAGGVKDVLLELFNKIIGA